MPFSRNWNRAGSSRPVWPVADDLAPVPAPLRAVWGDMALMAAIPAGQCGRKSLGRQLFGAQNAGCSCRVQSRANGNVHELGGIRRVHLSVASSPLEASIAG